MHVLNSFLIARNHLSPTINLAHFQRLNEVSVPVKVIYESHRHIIWEIGEEFPQLSHCQRFVWNRFHYAAIISNFT